MRQFLALILMSSTLSGCAIANAYWQKPTKYKGLPDKSDDAGPDPVVAVLSLDASRRLIVAQKNDTVPDGLRFTCSEPPPDVANNTLAQSLARLETKAGTSVSAASAYQIVAQVLSSRTPKVEMWRTASSTYCLLLMNKKDTEAAAYLKVAEAVIKTANDTTLTAQVAPSFINALSSDPKSQSSGQSVAPSPVTPANAEAKAEELAKAATACEKVPAADKATNADCLKVEAAKKVEELAKATAACEKVPAADKPKNADCQKVEAAKKVAG
jgi:hypothetical protein